MGFDLRQKYKKIISLLSFRIGTQCPWFSLCFGVSGKRGGAAVPGGGVGPWEQLRVLPWFPALLELPGGHHSHSHIREYLCEKATADEIRIWSVDVILSRYPNYR